MTKTPNLLFARVTKTGYVPINEDDPYDSVVAKVCQIDDMACVDMERVVEIVDINEGVADRVIPREVYEAPLYRDKMTAVTEYWDDHPDYPPSDWLHEVNDGNTRAGYWEWVENQIAQAADDADPDEGTAARNPDTKVGDSEWKADQRRILADEEDGAHD